MASPAKRPRNGAKDKKFYSKQARMNFKNFIDVGDKGYLVTCNFKERDSIHECYRLLNEYYDKSHPAVEEAVKPEADEEDDISSQLQDQIEKSKVEVKERSQKFQSLNTGVQNCLFIRASIDDPLTLGTTIIRDLAETKAKKTKVTLRFLPIETVCKAKIDEMKEAAGALFDKHFLKEPSTFAINFNKRFNNDMNRDLVIKELADIVALKNPGNKVNLNFPQKSIIVEIIKGHCLLSVVPDYIKLKKYNINELWGNKKDSSEKASQESEASAEKEESTEKEGKDIPLRYSLRRSSKQDP